MARVGGVFVVIQAPESQEEQLHTDPEEAGRENDQQSREEVPGEVTLGEATGGSGWRALTIPIIMDKIANLLSDKDLVSLCLTSKTSSNLKWKGWLSKLEAR